MQADELIKFLAQAKQEDLPRAMVNALMSLWNSKLIDRQTYLKYSEMVNLSHHHCLAVAVLLVPYDTWSYELRDCGGRWEIETRYTVTVFPDQPTGPYVKGRTAAGVLMAACLRARFP